MTDADAKLEASEQIRLLADLGCPPDIEDQLIWLLRRHRRATVYAISTDYAYGDVVQLSTRNGHRYRCIEAGTSAATEPTFPTRQSARLTDGTVKWIEDGPDYENPYDIRAAVHEAFMTKAAKCSHLVTTSIGNARTEASNKQAQFLQRAKEYAPLRFA